MYIYVKTEDAQYICETLAQVVRDYANQPGMYNRASSRKIQLIKCIRIAYGTSLLVAKVTAEYVMTAAMPFESVAKVVEVFGLLPQEALQGLSDVMWDINRNRN